MRRMAAWQNSAWRSVLSVFLSMVLALGGIPAVPVSAEYFDAAYEALEQSGTTNQGEADQEEEADAEGADVAAGEAQHAEDNAGADVADTQQETGDAASSDDADDKREADEAAADDAGAEPADEQRDAAAEARDAEKPAADAEQPAETTSDEEAAAEPVYASGKLSEKLAVDDKHFYKVTVSYGKEACIPEGATLHVRIPELESTKQARKQRQERLGQILELEDNDRILGAKYLDVWLELDGEVVEPATEVKVGIRTNDISAARSAAVEVALGMEDEQDSATEQHVVPENRTKDKKGAHTRLAFPMQSLGRIALATVVSSQDLWTVGGLDVSLLTPRYGLSVSIADADAPSLEEGVDLLTCCSIQVDPSPAYETVVWLAARRSDGDEDASAGVTAYRLRDDTSDRTLFGSEGTKKPVAFRAGDTLLVVRDSGYRNTTLAMSGVTVEGMMPEGTQGEAIDVTGSYEDPIDLLREVDADAAQEVEAGTLEVSTIAAYDITLEADGDEYQPDDEHPLTVTIASDAASEAIAAGKQLQVWHVADDQTVEVIDNYQLVDSVITFEAPGFSDYLLVAQAAAASEVRSTTFNVKCSALTYARTAKVTFVDENKDPIVGTVSGTFTISYTGGGSESNETNTIDMYSFIDKLSPDISDEYDFSRVFVQLTATEEKDFRYIQVGDNTAIGNSTTSPYRAYFNMDGVYQNRAGQDYNGTWYQLDLSGAIDNIYIEFYHVAAASFRAIDTRNDPIEGATFALYTDEECYTPFEYKDGEVTATSDKSGVVSFGKIPRGTYYMKETVIPEGYKKSTTIHTVVVDGETAIDDVVHEDDDGSIIITDVLRMNLTKQWADGEAHEGESVQIDLYAKGELAGSATLSAQNNWAATIDGLDPNEAYMVTETSVTSNGVDATQSWIPVIEYEENDPHAEYYKADQFHKGKQYVMVTTTKSGTKALVAGSTLTTTAIEVSEDGVQITGEVTDEMLWSVDTLTQDGVIALQNVGTSQYLDQNDTSKWYLNSAYPVPLYVRHLNTDGEIRFYHRANLNNAKANYLYVFYDSTREGQVDRYANDASKAAVFELYRKVNVRNVDVTITNKATEYPVRIKNVSYPRGEALPNMTFDLYREEDYSEANPGEPLMSSLTANANGFLEHGEMGTDIELSAGVYLLVQTSTLEEEGYTPLTKPVRFIITRGGALRMASDDQEFSDFTYATTITEDETTLPLLRVPNSRVATLELTLDVQGNYADLTRAFEFELTIPEGVSSLSGTLDGEAVSFDEDNRSFSLMRGQTLRLENVPSTEAYVFTQTDGRVAAVKQEGDGLYAASVQETPAQGTTSIVTVTQSADDQRIVTLSDLRGSTSDPARVTITNTLTGVDVPQTGLGDNVSAWILVVQLCACALAALFLRRLRMRQSGE